MSIRQEKVAKLLQKDLGSIFQQMEGSILPGKMITVTVVRTAPDLRMAKVYLSIFPSEDAKKEMQAVEQHKSEIRRALGNRIKNQLRAVPELFFYLDDSLDYAERINELIP